MAARSIPDGANKAAGRHHILIADNHRIARVENGHEAACEPVLTPRQREIVQLIAEGKINKQVAYTLDISVKTVETHRAAAMHKLKLRTTAELVLYAVRNNIVEP